MSARQLITSNHFDLQLLECSLATLTWSVVSTGGAEDSQKLSMNFLKQSLCSQGFWQRTQGRVSCFIHVNPQLTMYHGSGGHSSTNSLPKAPDRFLIFAGYQQGQPPFAPRGGAPFEHNPGARGGGLTPQGFISAARGGGLPP
jgi:hypothetical protein